MIEARALASLPGVRHGFFTREGGISEGPYDSLNCGFGSDDETGRVAENRRRATMRLGLAGDALCTAYQYHSNQCVTVTSPWQHDDAPRADAMATNRPGIALGILTADCTPVIFADARAGVIGAAHAGWRGALNGILDATVAAMTALGAEPSAMVAAVGPCIGPDSYEVGAEFLAAFRDADEGNAAHFAPAARDGHHMFDLPGYVVRRLAALGIGEIDLLARDTYADAERFFSYRRACHEGESDFGRLISAIALAE